MSVTWPPTVRLDRLEDAELEAIARDRELDRQLDTVTVRDERTRYWHDLPRT